MSRRTRRRSAVTDVLESDSPGAARSVARQREQDSSPTRGFASSPIGPRECPRAGEQRPEQGDLLHGGGLCIDPGEAGQVVREQRRPGNRLSGNGREACGRRSIRRLIKQRPQPRVLSTELLDFTPEFVLGCAAVQLRLANVSPETYGAGL